MNIDISDTKIVFNKKLNSLDRFVLEFTSILNKLEIKYVIVSGYVSILFGRNRTSEDIDIIVEKLDKDAFYKLWNTLAGKFECIITPDVNDAYSEYLLNGLAIRFSKKDSMIPNIEYKLPKTDLDEWTLNERKQVILNDYTLFISPLELQIPYKLFLGSEKDIEDARFLYKLFQEQLDMLLLKKFIQKLKTDDLFKRYLE